MAHNSTVLAQSGSIVAAGPLGDFVQPVRKTRRDVY